LCFILATERAHGSLGYRLIPLIAFKEKQFSEVDVDRAQYVHIGAKGASNCSKR
jgi:hypothetical protein